MLNTNVVHAASPSKACAYVCPTDKAHHHTLNECKLCLIVTRTLALRDSVHRSAHCVWCTVGMSDIVLNSGKDTVGEAVLNDHISALTTSV